MRTARKSLAVLAVGLGAAFAATQPLCAPPDDPTHRALIERDRQSALFSLQLQQSQRKLDLPTASGARRERDALDLEQQQEQQRLGEQQLRQLTGPPEYDRARIERERRAQEFQMGAPSWGPKLGPEQHWTPTLEPVPAPPWTPTLRGN